MKEEVLCWIRTVMRRGMRGVEGLRAMNCILMGMIWVDSVGVNRGCMIMRASLIRRRKSIDSREARPINLP